MLEQLKTLLAQIEAEHVKFEKGNAAAGTRVRVKSMELIKAAKGLRLEIAAKK